MNKWVRRVLIVLEIGGGFTGFSVMLTSLTGDVNLPAYAVTGLGLFACVFLFGIVSGLTLVDNSDIGVVLSAVYQLVQIPIVSSSWVAYRLFSGVQIAILWSAGRAAFTFDCGARSFLAWMHGEPLQIGINVLALGLFLYLLREFWRHHKRVGQRPQRLEDVEAAQATAKGDNGAYPDGMI